MDAEILKILEDNLPSEIIRKEKEDLEIYGTDWTRYFNPNPTAVLFPRNIEEVQQIILLANQFEFVIVPSGGRTGLSGGAVASNQEVVLSLDKMDRIIEWNELDRTLKVQAGIITEKIHEFAKNKNLLFPIDFASKGSSRIGGNIATNAGGINVVKYGMMREWITGLKVVTGKGDILDLNQGLIKNASGYDLRHLFIGSEGTLGCVVEADLKLTRCPQALQVIVFGIPDMEKVVSVMNAFREKIDFSAFEFFSDNTVDYVMEHTDVKTPLPRRHPFYVLMEFESEGGKNNEIVFDLYRKLYKEGWIEDDAFAGDAETMKHLWGYRENISASISSFTPYKNDLSVRISNIRPFLKEINRVVLEKYPEFDVLWYGHIADGNLHLNILKPADWDLEKFETNCKEVNSIIFKIVEKYKGSISAEHGVGLLKKEYLHYSKSQAEINYMKELKKVFDPKGIMNRGKIFK